MKKWIAMMVAILLPTSVFAEDKVLSFTRPSLNIVNFQLTAKQWVTTQTGLLTISINATLSNADLVKARADILEKLAKIAKGAWHLTQFDRSQDSSGLEKLHVLAEARVPQEALTNVYPSAESASKPGASYSIVSIDFKPSLEEMQRVRMQLRERLYQQIQEEIIRINKVYVGQIYTLYTVVFMEGEAGLPLVSQPLLARGFTNLAASPAPIAAGAPLAISNEITLTAEVQVAANRSASL